MKKRILALLLAAITAITSFAGCGSIAGESSYGKSEAKESIESPIAGMKVRTDTDTFSEEVSYVMVYNPDIYDETREFNTLLDTGDLSSLVDLNAHRADGLEDDAESVMNTGVVPKIDDLLGGKTENLDPSLNRAGGLQPVYSEGDKHEFFYGFDTVVGRNCDKFTCAYDGDYCYVWTLDGSISDKLAKEYGEAFDNDIYEPATELFGDARFTDDGGKVHLMFYDFNSDSLMGAFMPADLYSDDELKLLEAQYGTKLDLNTGHAILNINSTFASNPGFKDEMMSTEAHEFQHLICTSNYMENPNMLRTECKTWLNETMSGFIEEYLYPGMGERNNRFRDYKTSERIRNGQSLYNFDTSTSFLSFDIGTYGSVFLLSEYLSNLGGSEVFNKVHSYLRNSTSPTYCEAEALYEALPASEVKRIDKSIEYPASLILKSEKEEWMSKMTLDFYLSLMKYDNGDPESFRNISGNDLLYDSVDSANIEGGGRIIIATKNGSFKIPEDADSGLIYIGFDKDMNPVSEILYK